VEHITDERTYFPSNSHTPSIRRRADIHTLAPLWVFVSVLLTMSFSVLILSMLAGLSAGSSFLHPNPFAAYEAIWPGQTIAIVSAYALRLKVLCRASLEHHPANPMPV
jgi:hypothetical protein